MPGGDGLGTGGGGRLGDEETLEEFKAALRSLTEKVCRELEGQEIPKRPIWTVVNTSGAAPHVALDVERPVLSDIRFGLSLGLLQLPEYGAVADAAENDTELREGIIIDAGGFIRPPERTNLTRALVTNFLWRYLREGVQLDWDEARFNETFDELRADLLRKSVVFHTTLPLSNLKVAIDALDFGEELRLLPASLEELERWLSPDRTLPPLGAGPPQWNSHFVDRPAVLHARHVIAGQPPPGDLQSLPDHLPRVNAGRAITALRLVLNAPISVIFQEQDSEGLMALGGGATTWGWSPPPLGPVATLDEEKRAEVIRVWQLLQTSPNLERLTLPLRRWESSLLRASFEDRLIDAWISLEALLLGGQEGELSYRAAVLLAELLGTSGADRKTIYDATRISYRWRSAIVHGLSTKRLARSNPLQETVRITTEYLRLALLKVLELPGRFDAKKLESDLLGRDAQNPDN